MSFVPMVVEPSNKGDRAFDLYSRMLRDRIIFLSGVIRDDTANIIVAQLLFLESEQPGEQINLYINSPGGTCTAGLAIYDTMQYIRSPVATYAVGYAASMGAIILCGGAKGKRFALPNSTILIHQPLGGAEGQASDIVIQAREIQKTKDLLYSILVKNSGQTLEKVTADCDRDYAMTAIEARNYGLIDEVMEKRPSPGQNM